MLSATLLMFIPAAVLAAEKVLPVPVAIGETISLNGTVTAHGADKVVRKLKLNEPVFSKDVIVTGARSNVEILFRDRSVFSQGADSRTVLDDYLYTADPSASKMLLKLGAGTFRYVTGEIVKTNPEAFAIETPTTTIGIRGTEVFAEITPDGEEIGVLSMTPGHQVDVTAGEMSRTITRAGYSVTSVDGRLTDPAPTAPSTRARVMKAAPQSTQGETGAPGHSNLENRLEAFSLAIDKTKSGLGGLEDKPDYGALHNISLQNRAHDRAESGRDSSVSAGLGSDGGDADGGNGGGATGHP
ncbi:FecR domain-containing protein [uncultured Pseudodesulfovibrio sp.]|uniref:FecR family protein n=1 Tax=uncultured Pseudodesulfovibrio sp. TaxID=2035858 RepID=UPI0029C7EBCB|nr:FecR domain-containing protein [uncultured Pseudodesulfovibrio sp.]